MRLLLLIILNILLTDKVMIINITDHKNVNRMLSIALKNIHSVNEFKTVKIGKKKIYDSGFSIQGVFNGLGLSSIRGVISSYFLPIQNGVIYHTVKNLLIDNDK